MKPFLEQRAKDAVTRMLVNRWIVFPICEFFFWLSGWEAWLLDNARGFAAWALGGFGPWY